MITTPPTNSLNAYAPNRQNFYDHVLGWNKASPLFSCTHRDEKELRAYVKEVAVNLFYLYHSRSTPGPWCIFFKPVCPHIPPYSHSYVILEHAEQLLHLFPFSNCEKQIGKGANTKVHETYKFTITNEGTLVSIEKRVRIIRKTPNEATYAKHQWLWEKTYEQEEDIFITPPPIRLSSIEFSQQAYLCDMRQLSKNYKVTAAQVGGCFKNIISAVRWLHSLEIVHGDLSYSNMLISYNGNNGTLTGILSDWDFTARFSIITVKNPEYPFWDYAMNRHGCLTFSCDYLGLAYSFLYITACRFQQADTLFTFNSWMENAISNGFPTTSLTNLIKSYKINKLKCLHSYHFQILNNLRSTRQISIKISNQLEPLSEESKMALSTNDIQYLFLNTFQQSPKNTRKHFGLPSLEKIVDNYINTYANSYI